MESDYQDIPVAVFGAGSWGTALAVSLSETGRQVVLWARRPEAADSIRTTRHHPTYLPEGVLPETVQVTSRLHEAATSAWFWVIATPSQAVRGLAEQLRPFSSPESLVVSVAKGIENDSLLTTTQVLRHVLTDVPAERIGILSGPSHAEEVAVGKPTTIVAAAPDAGTARLIQSVFMTPRLRVYINLDVLGVEIGGSVKNVLALAAGISEGVGYGDNTKAAIVTRGIAEMQRLGMALGAHPGTFSGLTGLGDLVVTCMSRHSRNRYYGEQIGKGRSQQDIEAEMSMVAEGVKTTASLYHLAQREGIEMPITEAVYAILFEGKSPEDAVNDLMTRSAKREVWLTDSYET